MLIILVALLPNQIPLFLLQEQQWDLVSKSAPKLPGGVKPACQTACQMKYMKYTMK